MIPEQINHIKKLLEAAETLTQEQIDAVSWLFGGTGWTKEAIIKEYQALL